ncbi:ESX-1 secretion-associated protein [Saccharothrix sp. AJ9571]|nr:ESX-1 secretion-associated protein [Saccharothrix sp. AJ9571]
MAGGHTVIIDALTAYSRKCGDDVAVPNEIARLVQQADVGDESWGVIGLVVKDNYTSMLADLQECVIDIAAGLEAASEKFGKAAELYQRHEDDSAKLLGEFTTVLNTPADSRTPTIGPAK